MRVDNSSVVEFIRGLVGWAPVAGRIPAGEVFMAERSLNMDGLQRTRVAKVRRVQVDDINGFILITLRQPLFKRAEMRMEPGSFDMVSPMQEKGLKAVSLE
jgi:hypothetical protein